MNVSKDECVLRNPWINVSLETKDEYSFTNLCECVLRNPRMNVCLETVLRNPRMNVSLENPRRNVSLNKRTMMVLYRSPEQTDLHTNC